MAQGAGDSDGACGEVNDDAGMGIGVAGEKVPKGKIGCSGKCILIHAVGQGGILFLQRSPQGSLILHGVCGPHHGAGGLLEDQAVPFALCGIDDFNTVLPAVILFN